MPNSFFHHCKAFPANLLIAGIYIVLAKIGLLLSLHTTSVTIFWPAGGFALAVLLLWGLKYLPGIIIGAIAIALITVDQPALAVILGLANVVESFVALKFTQHLRINTQLESRYDLWKLTFLVGGLASITSALIGSTAFFVSGIIAKDVFFQIFSRWWMADVLGIAFFTPLVLIWSKLPTFRENKSVMLEYLAIIIFTAVIAYIEFLSLFQNNEYLPSSHAWIIILVFWCALRCGRHAVTVMQLLIFTFALLSASLNIGHYSQSISNSEFINFWAFGFLVSLGGLTVTIMTEESKRIQTMLSETLNYQNALLNNFPFPIWLKNVDGEYLTVNDTFKQMIGAIDSNKILGKTDFELMPTTQAEKYYHEDFSIIKSKHPIHHEEEVFTNGTGVWFETYKTPVINAVGGVIGIVGFRRNINHRKIIEKKMYESGERLRLALDTSIQGWFDWNVKTDAIAFSPEYIKMLGHNPKSYHCSFNEWVFSIHPDDRDLVMATFTDCLKSRYSKTVQYHTRNANGYWVWISTIAKVIEWDNNLKPIRIVGTHMNISRQKRMELELKASEERWKFALEGTGDGMWEYDFLKDQYLISPQLEKLLEIETMPRDFRYQDWIDRLHPESAMSTEIAFQNILNNKTDYYSTEQQIKSENESNKWLLTRGRVVDRDKNGKALRIIGTCSDITYRKNSEEQLLIAALIYNNTSEGLLVTNAQDKIVAVNPAFTELTGYTKEELLFRTPKIFKSNKHDKTFYRNILNILKTTGQWRGEIWNKHKDNRVYAEWVSINSIYKEDGSLNKRVAIFSDMTERKNFEALLLNQANYDALTELPNRRLFNDRLLQSLKKADRENSLVALIFIDLDHFKEVNDSLGHEIGDQLLVEAASRIKACIRGSDTVARLGGDEFTVILPNIENKLNIVNIAQNIINQLSTSFSILGHKCYISASIGISVYPNDGENVETLLKRADKAMYQAKHAGRNCYRFYGD